MLFIEINIHLHYYYYCIRTNMKMFELTDLIKEWIGEVKGPMTIDFLEKDSCKQCFLLPTLLTK